MLPKIETILYATGLGPGAAYIFRYALALARQHKARIVAVHGMEPLSTFGKSLVEQYISHDSSEQIHGQARNTVQAKMQARIEKLCVDECDQASQCDNPVSAIHVLEGYPAQVIVKLADDISADLIVMGAQSHGKVSEIMMGSTTRKVLHNAAQPVLVVRIPQNYTDVFTATDTSA